jgi:hypothetical protein
MLRGEVRSAQEEVLADVRVAIEDVRSGIILEARTDRSGRFLFRLLPPGQYDVTAEALGYRPQRLVGVPLRPGGALDVVLRIAAAEPPVMTIDSVTYPAHGAGWSRAGEARWFGELEVDAPRDRHETESLTLLETSAGAPFAVQGLPVELSRYAIEGFAFDPMPGVSRPGGAAAIAPLATIGAAELQTHVADVQWDGAAGGRLVTYGRRGTDHFTVDSWAAGASGDFGLGRFTPAVGGAYDLARAGGEISGPIISDTAVFVLGGEWRRSASVQPRAWRIDDLSGALVAASARDAGLSLRELVTPYEQESDRFSGWGRFDWRIAEGHDLGSFANVSVHRAGDQISPLRATPDASLSGTGLDLVAGVSVASILSPRFANELRAAFVRTTRDFPLPGELDLRAFGASGIPSTTVVSGDLLFGASTLLPAAVERTAFRVEQALLIGLGGHFVKIGVSADLENSDLTSVPVRAGAFTFGGPAGLEARAGSFLQIVGTVPSAAVSTLEMAAFIQDTWMPTPGLELTAGLRYSDERLPDEGVQLNARWLELSGLRSDSIETRVRQFGPRLGFRWNVREGNRWIVRAGFGMYHDDVQHPLLAERITHDGDIRIRRAFGELARWPVTPDSTAAPVRGAALTLLGPEFRAPRSTRASFGISRVGATSIHLSSSYRHTDFLPARRDLNLLHLPSAADQYGRPIFGELRQEGELLGVAPGSNRRFDAFDIVTAVEATAFSDYLDATILVERRVARHVRFAASYTWSRTRDNWLAYPGVAPFEAFAPDLGTGLEDWSDDVSDFDVPHRFTLASEVELPLPLRPTFGAVYRMRSGRPFTPGFGAGVDANGDYASNDPAFVDATLPGMDVLLEAHECLGNQVGAFAARNSCRSDWMQFLDARVEVGVGSHGGTTARLRFDALNLLGGEIGDPDRALVLVDPNATLQSEADGTLRVPLTVNPSFGEPVRSLESPRVFRVGVEVSF